MLLKGAGEGALIFVRFPFNPIYLFCKHVLTLFILNYLRKKHKIIAFMRNVWG